MELAMEVSPRGDDLVLSVSGDIDLHTAPQIRARLAALHAEGHTSIVIDLGGVAFLDSSALGAFVAVHRELADAGGSLRLAAPQEHVRKVFRITRLVEVIPLYDTVDAACV